MESRRNFIKSAALTTGAVTLGAQAKQLVKPKNSKFPTRFIFMVRANGVKPHYLVPKSFSSQQKKADHNKTAFSTDLAKHELPEWMTAVHSHIKDMSIIQGLSAKGFAMGHEAFPAATGMFKVGNWGATVSDLKWATADVELGKLYPSPFGHIEVQCVDSDRGVVTGRAALEKHRFNYAYADPKTAFMEIFRMEPGQSGRMLKDSMQTNSLEVLIDKMQKMNRNKHGFEAIKMNNYIKSVDSIRDRNNKLKNMSGLIKKNLPELDKKYFEDSASTVMFQEAFTEIILAALKCGLTNTALFTLDSLNTPYTGLEKLPSETVGLHHIGHGKGYKNYNSEQVREIVRTQHMKVMNRLVSQLKTTPEGNGSMFDNTVVIYMPSTGEDHHSTGIEQPQLIIAGKNTKMNMRGQYIRLPYYGKPGCKTMGNWWTTLLNNHGNPIKHFGSQDFGLNKFSIDQKGPIKQFLV